MLSPATRTRALPAPVGVVIIGLFMRNIPERG